MVKTLIISVVTSIIVVVLAFAGYKTQAPQQVAVTPDLGAVETTQFEARGGLKIGNGNILKDYIVNTCNLIGTGATQAGSTTKAYDCAVPGLTSSYAVMAQLGTSTIISTGNGWVISSAKASTTKNFATVYLTNMGSSQNPSVLGIGSSTRIQAFTAPRAY